MAGHYDPNDARDIELYARKLMGKSLSEVLGDSAKTDNRKSSKGGLGQMLESLYFDYAANSNSEPDFKEAGVELKATPLKRIRTGWVSKERLVLNIINYEAEHTKTFKTSSFWQKNALLLLLFYLYSKDDKPQDLVFKIVRLWSFPPVDLKIIKDDWLKIVNKIKDGKAHEISEGDTLYLGACTKGKDKNALRVQPYSKRKAMQRAFALKSRYVNSIIEASWAGQTSPLSYPEYKEIFENDNLIVQERQADYRVKPEQMQYAVNSISDYLPGETFEAYVNRKFEICKDLTLIELCQQFNIVTHAKHKIHLLVKAVLGIEKDKKIAEFEKAGIILKTIRVKFGGGIVESMSFEQIQFKHIIDEDWEDSRWYGDLSSRFLFVVFKQIAKNSENYKFEKIQFWTMPTKDLNVAEEVWKDTQNRIKKNDFSNFTKISDNKIAHVRPKARNAADTMDTVVGTQEKKKCFWLNASYIWAQIH